MVVEACNTTFSSDNKTDIELCCQVIPNLWGKGVFVTALVPLGLLYWVWVPLFGVPISLSAVDPTLFSALLLGDSTSSESIIAVWPVLTVRQARLYAAAAYRAFNSFMACAKLST